MFLLGVVFSMVAGPLADVVDYVTTSGVEWWLRKRERERKSA